MREAGRSPCQQLSLRERKVVPTLVDQPAGGHQVRKEIRLLNRRDEDHEDHSHDDSRDDDDPKELRRGGGIDIAGESRSSKPIHQERA